MDCGCGFMIFFFFFNQKTAYEVVSGDWNSDVCSSDLGDLLLTATVKDDDEILEYITEPELIFEKYQSQVYAVIDGGYGSNEPSTVVDLTGDEPEIIRQGIGELIL